MRMKFFALVLSLFSFSVSAHAATNCVARVMPHFNVWDDRTYEAFAQGIEKVDVEYTGLKSALFRSLPKGPVIRIDLNEQNYEWNKKGGHVVTVEAVVYSEREDLRTRKTVKGQSFYNREAAITVAVQKVLEAVKLDTIAQKMGCEKLPKQ
jgi:hypothetical protein